MPELFTAAVNFTRYLYLIPTECNKNITSKCLFLFYDCEKPSNTQFTSINCPLSYKKAESLFR